MEYQEVLSDIMSSLPHQKPVYFTHWNMAMYRQQRQCCQCQIMTECHLVYSSIELSLCGVQLLSHVWVLLSLLRCHHSWMELLVVLFLKTISSHRPQIWTSLTNCQKRLRKLVQRTHLLLVRMMLVQQEIAVSADHQYHNNVSSFVEQLPCSFMHVVDL